VSAAGQAAMAQDIERATEMNMQEKQ